MTNARGVRAFLCAGFALAPLLPQPSHALDAFWHGKRSDKWHEGVQQHTSGPISNWYTKAPPKGKPVGVPNDVAIFAPDALKTGVFVEGNRSIRHILYRPGSTKYTIVVSGANERTSLRIGGAGITNNSSVDQTYSVTDGARIIFENRSLAGSGSPSILTRIINSTGGKTIFKNRSSSGSFLVSPAQISNAGKGRIIFKDKSTANDSDIINNGTDAIVSFMDRASLYMMTISNLEGTISLEKSKRSSFLFNNIYNQGKFIVGLKEVRTIDFIMAPGSNIIFYLNNIDRYGQISAVDTVHADGKI